MKLSLNGTFGVATAMVLGTVGFGHEALAVDVIDTDDAKLSIEGRMQLLAGAESVDDPVHNDIRPYVFLKQGRLSVNGRYVGINFFTQFAFGGEDEVKAPSPGVSLGLLDFGADIPVFKNTYIRVGQFKVPYGREQLTSSGYLQFSDRSINHLGFRTGRDVGAALHAYPGKLAMGLGVFTGGGRDVPVRYLPSELGLPLMVARVGFNSGVDKDLFEAHQNDLDVTQPAFAFYLNGLYTKDSLVGHSSVLGVKLADKSLLLNGNWNPYIGVRPLDQGTYWQAGVDAALRAPVGKGSLSVDAEANVGQFSNVSGSLQLIGGRVQAGYYFKPIEVAVRYATLLPDAGFSRADTSLTGGNAIQEITPAATWYIKGHNAKITLDAPIQLNAPVVLENEGGAYVLTYMPDQASYLDEGGGTLTHQTVIQARLMAQYMF